MKKPKVSIITVNYNGEEFLEPCINSLLNLNYPKTKIEIIVVDNGSSDKSISIIKDKFPEVKLLENEDNNYCKAVNYGIEKSEGENIGIINNDVKVDENWLIELVKVLKKDEEIGAVGSKILFMDGRIQSVGHQDYPDFYWVDRGFGEEDKGQYDEIQEVPSLSGVSVVYRRECLKKVGKFDEFFGMYLEDIDMSIRIRKRGWKLLVVPSSKIYHHLHGTIKTEKKAKFLQEKNRLNLLAKHYPEKLPSALCGSGFLIKKGSVKEEKFVMVVAEAYKKLCIEHGIEKALEIIPELFDDLRKIFYFEKDTFIHKIMNFENKISGLKNVLQDKNRFINELESKKKNLSIEKDNLTERLSEIKYEKRKFLEANSEKGEIIDNLVNSIREQFPNKITENVEKIIKNLSEEIKTRNKLIDEYSDRVNKLNKKNIKLEELMVRYENKIDQLAEEKELNNLNKQEIKKLEKEKKELKEEISNKTLKFMKYKEELNFRIEDLEKKINEGYEPKIEKLEEEISDKDIEIVELKEELISRIENFKKIINEQYKPKIKSLSTEKEKLEKEVAGQSARTKNLKEQLQFKTEKLEMAMEGYFSKCKELNDIYTSTGFKFLLRPLWTIIGFPKRFIINLKTQAIKKSKKIFSYISNFREINFTRGLKQKIKYGYYFYIKKSSKNNWTKHYLNHIFKETIPPLPNYLTLMLTSKCNLNCKFCTIPERKYNSEEISKEEVIKIIDSASRLGIEEIELTGGEPLLHTDLWEIIDYIHKKDLNVHLVTNGILIKENIDKIKNSPLTTVSVSVDGKKDTYEYLRNVSGVYERVREGINLIKGTDINIIVNFVVMKSNVFELEDVYSQFDKEGVKVQFWPVNDCNDLYLSNREEIKSYLDFISQLRKERKLSKSWYRYLKQGIKYFKGRNIRSRCLGLAYTIAVDVEGTVLPCCVWDKNRLKLGNIYEDNLETLFYSQKADRIRKSIFNNGCENCYNSALAVFNEITKLDFA